MDQNVTKQVIACLRGMAAGCSKIASLHAESVKNQAAAAEAAKQAAAPDKAVQQLAGAAATKIAGLFDTVGISAEGMAQSLLSHSGALDMLNKVLDSVQADKTAGIAAINQPASGLGQPGNPSSVSANTNHSKPTRVSQQPRRGAYR